MFTVPFVNIAMRLGVDASIVYDDSKKACLAIGVQAHVSSQR